MLLQYSSSVRDAYAAITHLPEDAKQRFRAAVLEPSGHNEAKAVAARLLDEDRKRMRPFDSAEANDLLAKARELGSAAEKEFMDVMELLGASASPSEVFDEVKGKYGLIAILGNVQNMLAYLEKHNYAIRVVEGNFFSTIYKIAHPMTCEPTFGDADTLQAFCRRVWEQQLNPNGQTWRCRARLSVPAPSDYTPI